MSKKITKVGEYDLFSVDREYIGVPENIFFDYQNSDLSTVKFPSLYVENFLSNEDSSTLYIEGLKNYLNRQYATVHDYSVEGTVGSKVDTSGRYTHYLPISQQCQNVFNKVNPLIFKELHKKFKINGQLVNSEPWQLLGYDPGYFFIQHCDNCVGLNHLPSGYKVEENQTWWCNTPRRKFTVLLYTNDCYEPYSPSGTFSGGQLKLNRFSKNGQSITITPKKGLLVAFPSNFLYMHEVLPITRGYRICAVTWLDVI